jgi:ACT domain-containing protein
MHDFFTMIMLVDTGSASMTLDEIGDALHQKEEEMHLSIRIQREDIFNAMHRI